tara:strand:- start:8880 stop:9176 length:297 start_codon:yes stop_codon:yes gene_type:complete
MAFVGAPSDKERLLPSFSYPAGPRRHRRLGPARRIRFPTGLMQWCMEGREHGISVPGIDERKTRGTASLQAIHFLRKTVEMAIGPEPIGASWRRQYVT